MAASNATPRFALLDDEMATLQELPHLTWAGLAGTSRVRDRRGPDGRMYHVRVDAIRASLDTDTVGSIEVTVTVRPASWFALRRASRTFTSRPGRPTPAEFEMAH